MGLKLEVGKFYRDAEGRKVGPMYNGGHGDGFPWSAHAWPHYYSNTGRLDGADNDLIALWQDAPTGPVRTVTHKEIVPGVYGSLRVNIHPDGSVFLSMDDEVEHDASDIRALIVTLSDIADALEDQ